MTKFFLIISIGSLMFIYGKEPLVKDLILLNNPLLNSGKYRDSSSYNAYNFSIGREFSLNNNIDTSLYLSYSKINNKDKYYGLKSSIGLHK